MKTNNPTINSIDAGQGLGALKFGLERSAVELLLGSPDEKEEFCDDDHGEWSESWHYDDLELSLAFDEEGDWRLSTIAVASPEYQFRGLALIGLTKVELKQQLEAMGVTDLEYEDWSSAESPSHELLESESTGINFWFDDNRLSEIQWVPLLIDDETIDWPVIG